jgi:hypothetical protein
MNRKLQFLQAVQILAPKDHLVYWAASRVPEESLPPRPGGVALQFVVGMNQLLRPSPCRGARARRGLPSALSWRIHRVSGRPRKTGASPAQAFDEREVTPEGLILEEAIRVRSAEYWLGLGEPGPALAELGALPVVSRNHPWVVQVQLRATSLAQAQEAALALAC